VALSTLGLTGTAGHVITIGLAVAGAIAVYLVRTRRPSRRPLTAPYAGERRGRQWRQWTVSDGRGLICRLFGHHWSDWWMASDARWYRQCQRGCGAPFESRVDDD